VGVPEETMMGASFIGAMMDHILEGMMIPKVQISARSVRS
jgi:hypothetical protein